MDVSIDYCLTCNYRPMAAGLSIAIEKATGLRPVLAASKEAGAFEVRINGELIFSKNESGRFPRHSEIIEILRRRCSTPPI